MMNKIKKNLQVFLEKNILSILSTEVILRKTKNYGSIYIDFYGILFHKNGLEISDKSRIIFLSFCIKMFQMCVYKYNLVIQYEK